MNWADNVCPGETLIEHFERCVPGGREALAKARRELEERQKTPVRRRVRKRRET